MKLTPEQKERILGIVYRAVADGDNYAKEKGKSMFAKYYAGKVVAIVEEECEHKKCGWVDGEFHCHGCGEVLNPLHHSTTESEKPRRIEPLGNAWHKNDLLSMQVILLAEKVDELVKAYNEECGV